MPKTTLHYPQFRVILDDYLNQDEFHTLSGLTISGKRLALISFFNYLGENGVTDLGFCQQGKFDEAIPYLNAAAELSELYGDTKTARNTASLLGKVYYTMGVTAFNAEDFTNAIEVFAKGYAANPTDTLISMALAESYSKSGDLENGMKIYAEIAALGERHSRYASIATKAKSRMAEYLLEVASHLAKSNLLDEAYEVIDGILEDIDETNPMAHLLRLQWANNAKQYAKVIEWGEKAAEAQSDEALKSTAYYLLGAAYQNSERMDEAIAQYSKVTAGQYAATAKTQIAEIRKAQAAK